MQQKHYITITKTHIQKAKKLCKNANIDTYHFCCMLAIAVKERFNTEDVYVGGNYLFLNKECYSVSPRLEKEIWKFDNNEKPKPGKYLIVKE